MKILLALPYIPYPLNSGGNQAVFSMVNEMRKEHQLTVALHYYKDRSAIDSLEKLWDNVEFRICDDPVYLKRFEKLPFKSLKVDLIDYFLNSFWRKYKRYANKHCYESLDMNIIAREKCILNDEMVRKYFQSFLQFVGEIAANEQFDLVQTEFYEMLPLVYYLPENVKKVFVHHELRFVRAENEVSLFKDVTPEDWAELGRQKDLETGMLRRYDNVIVLTQHDKEVLSEVLPEENIYVSPAIVKKREGGKFAAADGDLVFIGGSDHYPNMDGMLWFCEKVLPELRKEGFKGKVHIVGRWNKHVSEPMAAANPEVVFEGFVPDVTALLSGKISIVPIRIGSGMRMKILESAQAMSPFVTTVKGVEGLDFMDGRECRIEDAPEAFAKAIMELIADPRMQEQMADSAREKLESLLRPEEMLERRMEFYRGIAGVRN